MSDFKLVYIDDQIDAVISSSLSHYCNDTNGILEYAEVPFLPQDGYESILNNETVRSASIIVIDDRLFEDRSVQNAKVTGEEFKLVFKKYLPFIETIVITQNKADEALGTLPKYKSEDNLDKTVEDYYQTLFSKTIEEAIKNIKVYRKLADKFKQNPNWETVLQEKVIDSLQGMDTYNELTKSDIDSLIQAFQEVERKLEDGK